MKVKRYSIAVLALLFLLAIPCGFLHPIVDAQQNPIRGVWDNFEFSRPAKDWSDAAKSYGGPGVVDVVAAQASNQDTVLLPFPFDEEGYLQSYTSTDLLEPYLDEFDSANVSVILSIQPLEANVTQIIGILLSRYYHHNSLIGVNVDLEWKTSGEPNYASDEEKNSWMNEIHQTGSSLKLFLTYFGDYRHFPSDSPGLVVLFDGERDTETNLLTAYQNLSTHYNSVGIYTGYSSSSPPTATDQRILEAVPKTGYIIHTEDVFPEKTVLIFEMDDIEIDWNEQVTRKLLDTHLNHRMPVMVGIVPANFDNASLGTGMLAPYLRDLSQNYLDIFEMAQLGYSNNDSETMEGKSYNDQRSLVERGLQVLDSIGIKPTTFIPPNGSLDDTTLSVVEDLRFTSFEALDSDFSSNKVLILNSWVSLFNYSTNPPIIKTADQLMTEIDNKTDQNPIVITYQVKDFANMTTSKLKTLSSIMNDLTKSNKYEFMTAKQYEESLQFRNPSSGTSEQPFDFLRLTVLLSVGASITAASIYELKKHRSLRKHHTEPTMPAVHRRTEAFT
jgi:hypothetical protein